MEKTGREKSSAVNFYSYEMGEGPGHKLTLYHPSYTLLWNENTGGLSLHFWGLPDVAMVTDEWGLLPFVLCFQTEEVTVRCKSASELPGLSHSGISQAPPTNINVIINPQREPIKWLYMCTILYHPHVDRIDNESAMQEACIIVHGILVLVELSASVIGLFVTARRILSWRDTLCQGEQMCTYQHSWCTRARTTGHSHTYLIPPGITILHTLMITINNSHTFILYTVACNSNVRGHSQ